ncbi:MAG: ABC transporter ATP-binding protein [Gammaproteobacteria bacterium]|nr:ABC transporter ATP-binding protein [Gammaproteobacteria bacterium]
MKEQLMIDKVDIAYDEQVVIKQCQFSLPKGQILSLLGPSGCGKSTLLKAIAGLLPIKQGQIRLGDKVISAPNQQISPEQRGVGMIFQDYALFPHLTVADNVGFGLHKLSKAERQKKVAEGLALVRLSDFADRYPHELSGGQQQRVAIARTLVCEPAVMLFDEPFSNLDVAVRHVLANDIKRLLKQQQITAVFVTHDKNEAFAMADHIAIIKDGEIEQFGTPQHIYDMPRNHYVAEFLGNGMTLSVHIDSDNNDKNGGTDKGGWQTPIGYIDKKDQNKILSWNTDDGHTHIYLRPHQVEITADNNGQAVVKSRRFLGDLLVYRLELSNDVVDFVSSQRFEVGQLVNLCLHLS